MCGRYFADTDEREMSILYSALVIYKRGCYSLRFSFMMKVIG